MGGALNGSGSSSVNPRTRLRFSVPYKIVRKTTFGTGALTGVLFADRLDGSRLCSPFRSRAAD